MTRSKGELSGGVARILGALSTRNTAVQSAPVETTQHDTKVLPAVGTQDRGGKLGGAVAGAPPVSLFVCFSIPDETRMSLPGQESCRV